MWVPENIVWGIRLFSFLPYFWDKYTNTWFFKRAKIWQKEPYSTCLKPIFRLTLGTHNSIFGYVYEISLVLTIVIDFQKEIFHTVCISKKNLHLPQFLSLKKVAKNYYQSISGAALRSIAVDKTPKKKSTIIQFHVKKIVSCFLEEEPKFVKMYIIYYVMNLKFFETGTCHWRCQAQFFEDNTVPDSYPAHKMSTIKRSRRSFYHQSRQIIP